jgi:hypothetical protein
VPWRLKSIEQRNGRIDRYGQTREPQFKALILTSEVEGAKDDRTVAEKLLEKEEAAHRHLGTAEAVTGEYRAEREERRLIQDLLAGKTVEQSIEDRPVDDLFADLLGQVGADFADPDAPHADVPRLFADSEAFVKEAIDSLGLLDGVEDDGQMLAFKPPADLVQRLAALPADYLRTHDVRKRMRVTFNRELAQRKLTEARKTKTMWPDIAFLSDLHPLVEWVTDKVLVRLGRQRAPVISAKVTEPVFLVQGIYSNRRGHPTVVEWMAVTSRGVLDQEMTEVITRAGVGPGMINTGRPIDLAPLQRQVPQAVDIARAHLENRRTAYEAEVVQPLEAYRDQLREWRQLTLDGAHLSQRKRTEQRVGETVERQQALLDSLNITGEPLLRVLAVLVPEDDRS